MGHPPRPRFPQFSICFDSQRVTLGQPHVQVIHRQRQEPPGQVTAVGGPRRPGPRAEGGQVHARRRGPDSHLADLLDRGDRRPQGLADRRQRQARHQLAGGGQRARHGRVPDPHLRDMGAGSPAEPGREELGEDRRHGAVRTVVVLDLPVHPADHEGRLLDREHHHHAHDLADWPGRHIPAVAPGVDRVLQGTVR
jgi:hypothetical protein